MLALKLVTLLALGCALAAVSDARHVAGHRERGHHAGHRAQQQRGLIAKPHAPQTRVFPGALAIKKLVLLKFKKIVPISLILLRSSDDNEAELVPVYPTDQIPENVQFIPTPNGISGHKDVQAIAIPSELHDQLQISGLSNLENIEALLQQSAMDATANTNAKPMHLNDEESSLMLAENAPLNVSDQDEDQLLEGASVEQLPSPSLSRRLSADELLRSGVRNSPQQQTSVEEIPLLLYSAGEAGNYGQAAAGFNGRRFVAATPARRRKLHH